MNRREVLAGFAAGAVALPGCLGDSDGAGDGSPSATPTGTPTETAPPETAGEPPTGTTDGTEPGTDAGANADFVDETLVVPELAAPNSPDSLGVYGDRDEQFVVALLAGDPETAPPVEEIELVADGVSYRATTDVGPQRWGLFDLGGPYLPDRDAFAGWVVVRLPKPLDADEVRLSWPGGESWLADDALAALARPPASFEVRSFTAPETAEPGESVTVRFEVANTADVAGTFVAAVNRNWPAYGPVAGLRLPVAAGETATWARDLVVEYPSGDGARTLRFDLIWRSDYRERTVTVDPPTPTATETRPITPDPSE
ncbi:hypothetical protein [Halosimplex pelagicum]|uniref:Uncharacterized protein n=1 Tax=Halosimplex pelagicum TaxID=869886 RepID=A0A7D5P9Z3_9EURY|nr:hypothetical protein [Halosimplex pelagicum]QLH80878.1 hypothetical protein HZS54_04145 [Halosimplex pelagicum]